MSLSLLLSGVGSGPASTSDPPRRRSCSSAARVAGRGSVNSGTGERRGGGVGWRGGATKPARGSGGQGSGTPCLWRTARPLEQAGPAPARRARWLQASRSRPWPLRDFVSFFVPAKLIRATSLLPHPSGPPSKIGMGFFALAEQSDGYGAPARRVAPGRPSMSALRLRPERSVFARAQCVRVCVVGVRVSCVQQRGCPGASSLSHPKLPRAGPRGARARVRRRRDAWSDRARKCQQAPADGALVLQESGIQRGLVGDDNRQRRSGDDRGCTGTVESRKQHAGLAGAAGRCLKGFLHTHAGTHEHPPDHP